MKQISAETTSVTQKNSNNNNSNNKEKSKKKKKSQSRSNSPKKAPIFDAWELTLKKFNEKYPWVARGQVCLHSVSVYVCLCLCVCVFFFLQKEFCVSNSRVRIYVSLSKTYRIWCVF